MSFGNDVDALGYFFLGKGARGTRGVFPREKVRVRAVLVDAEMGVDDCFWIRGGSWFVWGAMDFFTVRGGLGDWD